MKEFFEAIVIPLIDFPEDLIVDEIVSDQLITLKVRCNNNDIGKLIGRRGRNAQAIRTICKAIAAKQKLKLTIEMPE